MLADRLVQEPTSTTLQITDGHRGKVEAPKSRVRAFQLTVDKARVALDVVTGMYSFIIL